MCRYRSTSGETASAMARSVAAMMPFIGVRISWLMLARNWLLASVAASACCLACSSSLSVLRCRSISVRSDRCEALIRRLSFITSSVKAAWVQNMRKTTTNQGP
ncbi:MAG: hypothetical protein ACD_75C00176G0001 [uncultured bacterium]|nr:MAG: hypothetical protein ACD_75C00176G0001 [uncultured bacterium]